MFSSEKKKCAAKSMYLFSNENCLLLPENTMQMYDFLMYEKYSSLLKSEMAVHSSILVWKIPWTEEPDGLQSMGSQESGITESVTHTLASLGKCIP